MFKNLTYGDLYDVDTALNVLLYWESKRKRNKRQIDLGDTVVTEATLDEVIGAEPVEEVVDELIEVDTIEELLGIEPIAEPVIDEEDEVFAPKCTDIEKAIAVLDGSCTDMDSEDFDSEVWAEANEIYYSMDDVDYAEEEELGVGTVISMSNKGMSDFFNDRIESIESWKEDETEWNKGAEIDYVYEDDELNVVEECDVTIFSFAKAFSCMMPRVA